MPYYRPNQDGTPTSAIAPRSHLGRPSRGRRAQTRASPRRPASFPLPAQEPLPPPRHPSCPGRRWLVAPGAALRRARRCDCRQLPLRLPFGPLFGSGRPRAPHCRGTRQGHALHGHAGPNDPRRPRPQSGLGAQRARMGGPLSLPRASQPARGSPRARLRAAQRSQARPRGGHPRPLLFSPLVRRLARSQRRGRSCARRSGGRRCADLAAWCWLAPSWPPPLRRGATFVACDEVIAAGCA